MAPPSSVAAQGIADAIADRLNSALDDYGSLLTNPGSVVADDNLAAGSLVPIQATARAACRAWARDGVGQSAVTDNAMGGICGEYLGNIGELPSGGSLAPPFDGGQCDGVLYRADLQTFSIVGQSWNTFTTASNLRGPISSLRVESIGTNQTRWTAEYAGPGGVGTASQTFTNGVPVARARWLDPVPQSGGANNCGDPPPDYVPPSPKPGLPPYSPTVPVPGTGDETPVDFTFNPDGTITINLPEIDASAEVNIGGGGDAGAGDPVNGTGDPSAVGSPIEGGAGTPNDDGDVPFGAAPAGRAWVGAFVQLVGADYVGNVSKQSAQQQVYPRIVGNVALKHGTARGTAEPIRSEWTSSFRRNDNLIVDGVSVNVLPSISYRVYPVSVEKCPENQCSN